MDGKSLEAYGLSTSKWFHPNMPTWLARMIWAVRPVSVLYSSATILHDLVQSDQNPRLSQGRIWQLILVH